MGWRGGGSALCVFCCFSVCFFFWPFLSLSVFVIFIVCFCLPFLPFLSLYVFVALLFLCFCLFLLPFLSLSVFVVRVCFCLFFLSFLSLCLRGFCCSCLLISLLFVVHISVQDAPNAATVSPMLHSVQCNRRSRRKEGQRDGDQRVEGEGRVKRERQGRGPGGSPGNHKTLPSPDPTRPAPTPTRPAPPRPRPHSDQPAPTQPCQGHLSMARPPAFAARGHPWEGQGHVTIRLHLGNLSYFEIG